MSIPRCMSTVRIGKKELLTCEAFPLLKNQLRLNKFNIHVQRLTKCFKRTRNKHSSAFVCCRTGRSKFDITIIIQTSKLFYKTSSFIMMMKNVHSVIILNASCILRHFLMFKFVNFVDISECFRIVKRSDHNIFSTHRRDTCTSILKINPPVAFSRLYIGYPNRIFCNKSIFRRHRICWFFSLALQEYFSIWFSMNILNSCMPELCTQPKCVALLRPFNHLIF